MTYQHYKLTDTLNIFQKVELNQFQSYITKSPTNNQIDTSGLDDLIDEELQVKHKVEIVREVPRKEIIYELSEFLYLKLK